MIIIILVPAAYYVTCPWSFAYGRQISSFNDDDDDDDDDYGCGEWRYILKLYMWLVKSVKCKIS